MLINKNKSSWYVTNVGDKWIILKWLKGNK